MDENKKKVIRLAVLKLIRERGFYKVPMSLISKEAGVAVGTIYFYFKSKQQMIDALYIEINRELSDYIKLEMENAETIQRKIQCFWAGYVRYCIHNPLEAGFLYQPGIEKIVSSKAIQSTDYVVKQLQSPVKQGVESNQLKDLPFEIILSYLIGPLKNLQDYYQAGRIDLDDETIQKLGTVFMDGIMKRSNEGETYEI